MICETVIARGGTIAACGGLA